MFLVIVIQRFSSYDLRIHTDFRSAVSSLVVVVFYHLRMRWRSEMSSSIQHDSQQSPTLHGEPKN